MKYRQSLMLADGLIVTVVVLVVAVLVSGCAHKPAAPIVVPPRAPPPILCQPIEERPALEGGIVAPITPAEIANTTALMQRLLDRDLYADRGWYRARVAKETYCP